MYTYEQSSFTNNEADDFLTTLIRNKQLQSQSHQQSYDHPSYQEQQQDHHQQQYDSHDHNLESDFTPFMKRHSSNHDGKYMSFHYYGNEEGQSGDYFRGEQRDRGQQEQEGNDGSQANEKAQGQQQPHSNLEDSFLQLVDKHLSQIQKDKEANAQNSQLNHSVNPQQQTFTLSKQEIRHCLLENQSITDSIQLTNLLPSRSIAKIINSPFQFRLLNAKNKFIKRDEVEVQLEGFEMVEIEFQIRRREGEIGNIYETLTIEICSLPTTQRQSQPLLKKFLKFQITFIKPKLQLSFLGKTSVTRIQQHKIALLEIHPNQLNEYFLNMTFSQQQFSTLQLSSTLQRIECQIETKGYVTVFPTNVILYQNEPLKIVLRRVSQGSFVGDKTSAIVIKPASSSLVYVVGVKCADRKVGKAGEEGGDLVKVNRLRL